MKILKKILPIILVISIIYMLYYIYGKLKENNIDLSSLYYFNGSNSVINITVPSNNYINLSVEETPITNNSYTQTSYTNNFYYKQLDSNAKIIYDKLEDNISNLKLENYKIDFSTQFNTLLNQSGGSDKLATSFQSAIDAFFYDHPELFYIDLTKMSLYTKSVSFAGKTTYSVSIIPENNKNYLSDQFSSQKQVEQAIEKVESVRNSFVNGVSGDDYNKVLQIHDTLINLIEYDTTYSKSNTYNIYGALIENKVVCEGYAKAFKYILDSINIPCILVAGTATNSSGVTEAHMWNYIQLDGAWYGVDPTWDDPIIVGSSTKSIISHDYFCKGSITFDYSHVINNQISETGISFTYPELSIYDYK